MGAPLLNSVTLEPRFQPGGTHDHCTVAVNRTAMFMAGGVGQESQAYIIDLKAKTRQPLQAMKQPRSQVLQFVIRQRHQLFVMNTTTTVTLTSI